MNTRPYVLGIGGSPRLKGNSDLLLDEALSGAAETGASVEKIVLNELDITPCQECGGCSLTGRCVVEDDMQAIYPKLRKADRFILASPIFFSGLTAQMKAMIDRTQACWVEKYVLKRSVSDTPNARSGLFISVGVRAEDSNFQGAERTVKTFFATQNVKYIEGCLFRNVEKRGDILKVEGALERARRAGREICSL